MTYFSSDVRCATRARIERLTGERRRRDLDEQIEVVGVPVLGVAGGPYAGNEHHRDDYRLISKTVIVSDLAKGQEVRWENLQDVWTKQRDEASLRHTLRCRPAPSGHCDVTLVGATLAAALLGLLTSVSPCPLATNVAAVSFLARRLESNRRATLGVLAYATGRASAYVNVGVLVAWGFGRLRDHASLQTVPRAVHRAAADRGGLVLLGGLPCD